MASSVLWLHLTDTTLLLEILILRFHGTLFLSYSLLGYTSVSFHSFSILVCWHLPSLFPLLSSTFASQASPHWVLCLIPQSSNSSLSNQTKPLSLLWIPKSLSSPVSSWHSHHLPTFFPLFYCHIQLVLYPLFLNASSSSSASPWQRYLLFCLGFCKTVPVAPPPVCSPIHSAATCKKSQTYCVGSSKVFFPWKDVAVSVHIARKIHILGTR